MKCSSFNHWKGARKWLTLYESLAPDTQKTWTELFKRSRPEGLGGPYNRWRNLWAGTVLSAQPCVTRSWGKRKSSLGDPRSGLKWIPHHTLICLPGCLICQVLLKQMDSRGSQLQIELIFNHMGWEWAERLTLSWWVYCVSWVMSHENQFLGTHERSLKAACLRLCSFTSQAILTLCFQVIQRSDWAIITGGYLMIEWLGFWFALYNGWPINH